MGDEASNVALRMPGRNGGYLVRPPKGVSGNPSGMSAQRRALLDAIEANHIPQVLGLLDDLLVQAKAGDVSAARLYLDQVRGPVKASEDDKIERAVEQKLVELIADARRRRIGIRREEQAR